MGSAWGTTGKLPCCQTAFWGNKFDDLNFILDKWHKRHYIFTFFSRWITFCSGSNITFFNFVHFSGTLSGYRFAMLSWKIRCQKRKKWKHSVFRTKIEKAVSKLKENENIVSFVTLNKNEKVKTLNKIGKCDVYLKQNIMQCQNRKKWKHSVFRTKSGKTVSKSEKLKTKSLLCYWTKIKRSTFNKIRKCDVRFKTKHNALSKSKKVKT